MTIRYMNPFPLKFSNPGKAFLIAHLCVTNCWVIYKVNIFNFVFYFNESHWNKKGSTRIVDAAYSDQGKIFLRAHLCVTNSKIIYNVIIFTLCFTLTRTIRIPKGHLGK